MKKIHFTIELPETVYKFLKSIKKNFLGELNLIGDREIEWSFVVANMPDGNGNVLDLGPGSGSYLGLIAAFKGFEVISIDLAKVSRPYFCPRLKFIQGDFLELDFSPKTFDLIINCSTVEHIGLAGRYGIKENRPSGDLETMSKMKELLKPGGKMLLTIPVGQDKIFSPYHRIYGEERLYKLLKGYIIEKEEYWIKNEENQWILTNKLTALRQIPCPNFYGLGCFVLGVEDSK